MRSATDNLGGYTVNKFWNHAALLATAAGLGAPVVAQETDEVSFEAIDEIIVTTTRRETNLMTTAGAISVFSDDDLVIQGVNNLSALDSSVPNLKVFDQQNQGMGAVQISMRGIVNSSFIEIGDPNVGFHVDGIYMSRPQAALNMLFDAQRMEIARGPQGTLFGRNSTVGSINVVNNRPDTTGGVSGNVTVEAGDFSLATARGVLNLPLVQDVFAVRLAGYYQERDTFYTLLSDDVVDFSGLPGGAITLDESPYRQRYGDGLGDDGAGALDQNAIRASLMFTPTADLSAYVSYEAYTNDSPIAPQTVRGNEYTAYLSNPHFTDQTIDTLRAELVYSLADRVDLKATYGDQEYQHEIMVDLDAGTYRYSPERVNPQPGDVYSFEQTFYDRDWTTDSRSIELTATSTYESDLQWLVGYFNFEEDTFRNFWIDLPLNADGIINFNQPNREAKSEAVFGQVDWHVNDRLHIGVGLRYTEDERTDTGVNRFSVFNNLNTFGTPVFLDAAGVSDLDYLCGGNLPVGPCEGVDGVAPGTVSGIGGGALGIPPLDDGSFPAAPGSSIANVHDGILANTCPGCEVFNDPITTNDQLRAISAFLSTGADVFLNGGASRFPRVFFTEQDFSYTDFSVTLDYELRAGTLIYGKVASGHKAGSQEIFYLPRLHQFINSIIEPEELVSYELGWKEQFEGVGAGLSVSSSLFYMDYTDKQQSVFVDGGDLFCADTFGDFNGDGLLDFFMPFVTGIPIFGVSANSTGLTDLDAPLDTQNSTIVLGPNGDASQSYNQNLANGNVVGFAIPDEAAAAAACSQGSTGTGGALSDQQGMPNFVELMAVNFGNAEIAGLEVEYDWNVTANDRLKGYFTVNFLNEINDPNADALPFNLNDSLACGDRVGGCPDITSTNGNELPFAPDFTAKIVYERDFDVAGGVITAGVDLTYNSDYWLSIWNVDCYESIRLGTQVCDNGDKQDAFTLLDLRLRYTNLKHNFYVEGFVYNATDEIYATGNLRPTSEESVTPFTFNAPRLWGARAGVYFD